MSSASSTPDSDIHKPSGTQNPSGIQYEIAHGPWRAVVTEQGATLRLLQRDGRDVVWGFGEDASPQGCQGQQLLPWPNRIRDGRYSFEGNQQQLALSEPERHNAIHGLVNWRPWQVVEQTAHSITQQIVVLEEPGWPGVLQATITHRLDDDGLVVEVSATNVGPSAVPYGYAAHPYLTLDAPIDEWELSVPFASHLVVDDRLLPIESHTVEGSDRDFRSARRFGATELDTAFGDPTDQRWSVTARHGERSVCLWSEPPCDWLQIYTPDDRASLAVEPMTCGPDAFNAGPTHDGVIRLEPGESCTLRWGITAD